MILRMTWVLFTIAFGLVSGQTPINLKNYLQPDRVTRQQYLFPARGSNLCSRDCIAGDTPRICYYKWIAEAYTTLGPQCGNCPTNVTACDNPQCVVVNGFEKSILTINRMVPGPFIDVCLGDRVIVDVQNNIPGGELAIHWHGVWQQGTQYMDGVPMVTQCSINEGDTFRYDFLANNEGTHYWHSHSGLQKLDGIQGNLVIRTPKSTDPNGNLFDTDLPEHNLMVMDWMNTTAEERFPSLSRKLPGQLPATFLLNGRGRPKSNQIPVGPTVPYQEVWVQRGKRHRLRFIAGLCTVCGVEITIEDHDMTLIATDGSPVNPVKISSIVMFSGERYDVVLNANQNRHNTYWIHMRGLAECSTPDEQIYQLAVLRYEGTNEARPTAPGYNDGFGNGVIVNPENATCGYGQGGICVSQLVSSNPDTKNVLNTTPRVNVPLLFGFNIKDRTRFFEKGRYDRYLVAPDRNLVSSWVNNISFVNAPSPIISQGPDIPGSVYCPVGNDGFPTCPANRAAEQFCECVYVIKIPLGEVIQVVLADGSPVFDLHHPFHLHGYDFFLVAIDQFKNGQTLASVSRELMGIKYNTARPPARKDTVAVPSNGYAAFRFRANNPGLWFFHCHFMYHLATGMAVVLQVGNDGDWPPAPRNFPRCGNFLNQPYVEDYYRMNALSNN